MRSWLVVLLALALLFVVVLGVAVGLDWFVSAFWPWSVVALLAAASVVASWVGRNRLRTRSTRIRFRAELDRIGVAEGTSVAVAPDGGVSISGSGGTQGAPRHSWEGSASDALRRLAGVADRSGDGAFWAAFPDRRGRDRSPRGAG